jgi:hypothetical protein
MIEVLYPTYFKAETHVVTILNREQKLTSGSGASR